MSQADVVVIQYEDLLNHSDLTAQIQKAYGPKGLGILFVQGIPDYIEARRAALPLFYRLAKLPPAILKGYERPEIFHSRGWSHGKEKFQGQHDVSKGSYYVNCSTDAAFTTTPDNDHLFTPEEKKLFSANRWVDHIPEIEVRVKALSRIMMDVGALVATQIDAYAASQLPSYPPGMLHRIIKEGQGHIGRMLHYFPYEHKLQAKDDWCGWHNDHGSLTALTSALYTDEGGDEIKFPVKTGGLYAKSRDAEEARIVIPADMLAFQLGESTQIHTGGRLAATPHCVVRSEELAGSKVSRNTFALFMQPDPLEKMSVPPGVSPEDVLENPAQKVTPIANRWANGIPFKEFHHNTIMTYA